MSEEYFSDGKIFADKEVLRSSYIPRNLPHRKEQIASLTDVLSTTLKRKTPSNILVFGKTGTGKTATVKYVCNQFEEMARTCNYALIFINCELFYTHHRVLSYLARFFNKRVPVFGWPTDAIYSEIKEKIDTEDRYVVVILDEMDKLVTKEDETLYKLLRINSELNKVRISVIGISNFLPSSELQDQRSSVGAKEIIFPTYSTDQLKDILTERVHKAFNYSALDDAVIPLCAALATKRNGDAKRAIDLLLMAGKIAERTKSKKVVEEHVRIASKKIEANSTVRVVKTMPLHHKILLSSVLMLTREKNERYFISGEVYCMYRRLCDHLGAKPLTQRRLIDLISELDSLELINAVTVNRGRYGMTREISLNVPEELIQPVLFADYELKTLSNFSIKALK